MSEQRAEVDQRALRPSEPVENLAAYLRFLEEIEALFGPAPRPAPQIPPPDGFKL